MQANDNRPFLQSEYPFTQEFNSSDSNWLVDQWLINQNITIISGQPQVFKTYLALDLAKAITTGCDFLDQFPVKQTGNVMIIQQEDSLKNFARRLVAIDDHYYNVCPTVVEGDLIKFNRNIDNEIVIPRNYRFSFDEPNTLALLEQMIILCKPILVIIDPLRSTSNQSEGYFAMVGKQIDDQLRPLRDRYGVGFAIVHHNNKAVGDDIQSSIYGSNLLIGSFETKIVMQRVNTKNPNDARIKVTRLYKEESNLLPIELTFKIDYKADEGKRYQVDVNQLSEEDRKIELVAQFLIDSGAQSLDSIFKNLAESLELKGKSGVTQWLERHSDRFVKTERGLWAVVPDRGL